MPNRQVYTEEEMTAIRQYTDGFYKLDQDGSFLYGRFYVLNANYELHRHLKDTYTYPVDGWAWFDSEEQAMSALGYVPPKTEEEIRAEKLEELEALKQELGLQ